MGNQEVKELRLPPQNLDAEKAVLGAMMLSEDAIGTAIEHLDGPYFYETRHQKIFESIKDLYASRRNIDLITLSDHLRNNALFESIGGQSYLTDLADFVPTAANARYYID